MLLTIDVGNTHTVLGLFDGEDIVEHWRISTDARRTADELAVLLQGLMGMHPLLGDELGDGIDGIAICATVPSVLHELREVTRRYYGDVPAVLVEPGVKTGVPILTDNPKEVGADRIINGFAGQVDGVVTRMARELADDPDDVTVIATGGLAPMVLGESSVIDEHEPWLTLIGLRLVYERNVSRM